MTRFAKIILSTIIVAALFQIVTSYTAVQAAPQKWPNPGINCGVGYPDKEAYDIAAREGKTIDPNGIPDTSEGSRGWKYSCCATEWQIHKLQSLVKFPEGVKAIPGIGEVLTAIERMLDIFNFPNNFFPIDISFSAKTFYESVNKPENVCVTGQPVGTPGSNSCYCKMGASAAITALAPLCLNITSETEQNQCFQCLGYKIVRTGGAGDIQFLPLEIGGYTGTGGGIWTGIGCVKTTLTTFIQETVFGIGIGLAGLVALGCMIYSAFLLQTSQGNAEKITTAQDMMKSCIFGLLLIIFSVFILRVIGVNILQIPGFN